MNEDKRKIQLASERSEPTTFRGESEIRGFYEGKEVAVERKFIRSFAANSTRFFAEGEKNTVYQLKGKNVACPLQRAVKMFVFVNISA